jgi:large subunit ribosomal protein L16
MRFFLPPNYKIKKKFQKQRIKGFDFKPTLLDLTIGNAGLKALENGRLTPKQLEATRRVITRKMNRTGRVWFKVAPEIAISKKPQEIRMGKGKGLVKLWVAKIKTGRVIVEISNVSFDMAKDILLSAATKLPLKTLLLYKKIETF